MGGRRRSLRPRTPDTPAAANGINFSLPTPKTPSFGFRDRGKDSDEDWEPPSQLDVTSSEDEDVKQESPSNWTSALDNSVSKPSRRSQRLATSTKQRASDKEPFGPRTPLNKPKPTTPGRLAPAAVKKTSQRVVANSKPARDSKIGRQGPKKSPVTRRNFHMGLSRQAMPEAGDQIHISQTKDVGAVSPDSRQAVPTSEITAPQPALVVFSGAIFQSNSPPESGMRLEPWEVAPGRLLDYTQKDGEYIAFSTTSLTGLQETQIGHNLGFHVLVLRPGNRHRWLAVPNKVRVCSVVAGKISGEMAGQSITVGPHGLFKIVGGVQCTV